MSKPKISLAKRLINLFTSHPWLKLISLVLAIIAWFYVSSELSKFNY